jgi:hypothetical protein
MFIQNQDWVFIERVFSKIIKILQNILTIMLHVYPNVFSLIPSFVAVNPN